MKFRLIHDIIGLLTFDFWLSTFDFRLWPFDTSILRYFDKLSTGEAQGDKGWNLDLDLDLDLDFRK